jgi:CheY-like chemotaxis protein
MPHKILALKDRPEYALALKTLIEPHGYQVLAVQSIDEALEVLSRESVDMIIVAVHLQEGNIFDFIRIVRADPDASKRSVPIVCLNVNPRLHARYLNDSLEVSAMALGANRFITMEPYDAASLWKDINTMLPPESTKKVQIKKIESIKGRKEF